MTDTARSFEEQYLAEARRALRQYRKLGEDAMAQMRDDELLAPLGEEDNSVALIVKHLWGNMRSRWRDFLTADGEKPDRNRDAEFELEPGATRDTVTRWWEEGWRCVFDALDPLGPADLARTVHIRGEPHSVLQAINRQVAHYSYHVGQIVLLAKHARGEEWKTLSIAKGGSQAFNVGKGMT